MNAAVHIVPAAGVDRDKGPDTGVCPGRHAGTGIATAALHLCEQLDGPADLVLLAVPAGRAEALVEQLRRNGRV